MPARGNFIYWDACTIISYLQAIKDRVDILEEILFLSSRGKGPQVITSVLSKAEVAYVSKDDKNRFDPVIDKRVDQFWADESAIKLVDVSELVADRAREIMRASAAKGWTGLRSADALHLATASRLLVSAFHTYDKKLYRYAHSPNLNFPIREAEAAQLRLPDS